MQAVWEGQLLHWKGHSIRSSLLKGTQSQLSAKQLLLMGIGWGKATLFVEDFGGSTVRKIVALLLKDGYLVEESKSFHH